MKSMKFRDLGNLSKYVWIKNFLNLAYGLWFLSGLTQLRQDFGWPNQKIVQACSMIAGIDEQQE